MRKKKEICLSSSSYAKFMQVLFSAGFNFKNKSVTRNAAAAYLVHRHHDRSYPY